MTEIESSAGGEVIRCGNVMDVHEKFRAHYSQRHKSHEWNAQCFVFFFELEKGKESLNCSLSLSTAKKSEIWKMYDNSCETMCRSWCRACQLKVMKRIRENDTNEKKHTITVLATIRQIAGFILWEIFSIVAILVRLSPYPLSVFQYFMKCVKVPSNARSTTRTHMRV